MSQSHLLDWAGDIQGNNSGSLPVGAHNLTARRTQTASTGQHSKCYPRYRLRVLRGPARRPPELWVAGKEGFLEEVRPRGGVSLGQAKGRPLGSHLWFNTLCVGPSADLSSVKFSIPLFVLFTLCCFVLVVSFHKHTPPTPKLRLLSPGTLFFFF